MVRTKEIVSFQALTVTGSVVPSELSLDVVFNLPPVPFQVGELSS